MLEKTSRDFLEGDTLERIHGAVCKADALDEESLERDLRRIAGEAAEAERGEATDP